MRSPLRCLERLGVIPRLVEDLAVAKLEEEDAVEDLAAVVAFGLGCPQISGAGDSAPVNAGLVSLEPTRTRDVITMAWWSGLTARCAV